MVADLRINAPTAPSCSCQNLSVKQCCLGKTTLSMVQIHWENQGNFDLERSFLVYLKIGDPLLTIVQRNAFKFLSTSYSIIISYSFA